MNPGKEYQHTNYDAENPDILDIRHVADNSTECHSYDATGEHK